MPLRARSGSKKARTGYGYTVSAIMSAQHNALEASLWTALRILEERIDFFRRMAKRYRERGDRYTAERYNRQIGEHEQDHARIRQSLADLVSQRRSTAS